MAFEGLFAKYDRMMIFDTETTGLHCDQEQIIEFAAVVVTPEGIVKEYDELISLDPGTEIPPEIVKLTGITNEDVAERGISKTQLCRDIAEMISGNTLLLAYNAQFDLCFTFYLLAKHGDPAILRGKDKIDLLTVYKDRREYPHKLKNAIDAYGLAGKVVNSHRAVDDVIATVAVMEAMEQERNDLEQYINLFGYNPNYDPPKPAIRSITYKAQPYNSRKPLYK
ncbi:MAG: 3'-5' exonuclease [Oscillospiraceae bacterium]|nr:3'-5' exonuclease [Oscillospiraceae bacterium]